MKIAAVPETFLERLAVLAGMAPTPVVDTFHAVIVARAIMVATKLGVFDAAATKPQTADGMASTLDVNAKALEKLLNLLVATRYLTFAEGRYALTRVARTWLLSGSRQSLHDNMLFRFLEWQAIEATEDFVRTGKALDAHDLISGGQWDTYQRGMRSLARFSAGEVARRVRLPGDATTMLDIGGGHGAYSVAFCERHPRMKATILDLPVAVESATPLLAEEDMGDRVVHCIGDALTEDLGEHVWDLVFISHLVHHFEEAENAALLVRVARSLRPNGIVAILDVVRPPAPATTSQTGAILDLYFAVTSNAGTWSETEVDNWFEQAGLAPRRAISLMTAPGITVLSATKPTA